MHFALKRTFEKMSLLQRSFNTVKTFSSYHWSKWTGSTQHWGKPISVSIEPTTACNLGCPECPSGLKKFSRPTGKIDLGNFNKWTSQLKNYVSYITFYFQGEPYLNPGFLEMVTIASEKNIFTATSTNAHFLNDEKAKATVLSGLKKLIISVDGTTQEVYEQYRVNGSLEKVIKGTRNIVKWKKELRSKYPKVVFQFLVVKPNEHQIEDVKKLGEELGVDKVVFKSAQVYDYENGNSLIPETEKYSRYKKRSDGRYELKNKLADHCWRLWSSCVITWDGKVVPCCFDKDAKHQLGDLNKSDFDTIWNGAAYQAFRSKLLNSRKEIDICKNCSEGTKVWVN
ncbi:MAG: radical SAM protein [Flavobacteriales bacterium]|nr:radical SAM protein [Flavobacteriales bacterium]